MLAANYRYFSGKPWAATTQVSLGPQGSRRILLEAPGSRRLSSQSLLDFRVSRTLRFGAAARVELLMDLLNLLNDTAEEGAGDGQPFQLDVRTAERVHQPAARDAERAIEPGTVNDASSTTGHRLPLRGRCVRGHIRRPLRRGRGRACIRRRSRSRIR